MLHFVIGGARSGKSRYAEQLAASHEAAGKSVFYIATASLINKNEKGQQAIDKEMLQRVEKHQSDRPKHWNTIESPLQLATTIKEIDDSNHCILVDCLTLWTLNLMQDNCLQKEKSALLKCLPTLSSEVIIVSNEVGMGIIPLGKFTRQYVDELGWLHQEVATVSDNMTFMVAGQSMNIKSNI